MRFVEIFNEARRNPHVSPRFSTIDQLRKYEGRENIFVSFTDDVGSLSHETPQYRPDNTPSERSKNTSTKGAKLGINPKTTWNTPYGVYAYPLEYVLKRSLNVEFGSDRAFLWVFTIRKDANVLFMDEYTFSDLRNDLKNKLGYDNLTIVGAVKKAKKESLVKTPAGYLWNITLDMAVDRAIDAVRDYLASKSKEEKWIYGRRLEKKYTTGIWSKILRSLYQGYIDRAGEGIIHRNEPTQALFLDVRIIQPLEVISNKYTPQTTPPNAKIWSKSRKGFLAAARNEERAEEVIDFIQNFGIPEYARFSDFSPTVQNHIRNNFGKYVSNKITTQDMGLTKRQVIEYLKKDHKCLQDHPELIRTIVDEVSSKELLLFINAAPIIFEFMPHDFQTTANAKAAFLKLCEEGHWRQAFQYFPEHVFDDEMWIAYYYARAKSYSLSLPEVPKKFRTPEIVEQLIAIHPDDAAKAGPVFTEDMAVRLMNTELVKYLPLRLRTAKVAEAYVKYLHREGYTGYHFDYYASIIAGWPKTAWTPETVISSIKTGAIKDFNVIPKRLRTKQVIWVWNSIHPIEQHVTE